jgi:hypothetical protein
MYDGSTRTYYLGSITLTSDKVFDFDAPDNGRWRVVDIQYRVSTTFAGATRTPGVKAGSTTDDDLLIDDTQLGLVANGNTVRSMRIENPTAFNDREGYGAEVLENGDTLRLSILAATGSGAAGVAEFWAVLQLCGGDL